MLTRVTCRIISIDKALVPRGVSREYHKVIGIYKWTNKINNKSYIGQSIHIEQRKRQHIASAYYPKSNTYNSLFHMAIRKYGLDNFDFEILTICKVEELDTLEKMYIKKFNSLMPNGYNMTPGGENARSQQCLFTVEDIENIIFELETTYDSADEIAERWGCSASLIKKISRGEEYYLDNKQYPVRSAEHIAEVMKRHNNMYKGDNPSAKLSIPVVENIIYDLLNTDISINELSEKYNISKDQISRINNGKIWLQVERPIPCRDVKKINEQKALMVADLLKNTNLSQREILNETGYKDRHTVARINNHQIYQELLKDYPNPIRRL